jgi:hypothetical protein
MSTETTTTKRTIALTNRPPVTITEEKWPRVAWAYEYDTEHECQANRWWHLNVRQHEDGRAIVYGKYETCLNNERETCAGEVVPAGEDIVAAIRRVAETLALNERSIKLFHHMAQDCIADLPAQELEE